MKDAMLEALRRKKANGLDITILLGQPEVGAPVDMEKMPGESDDDSKAEKEQEVMGLAPEGEKQVEHEDKEADKALIEEMMMQYGLAGKNSLSNKAMAMKKAAK